MRRYEFEPRFIPSLGPRHLGTYVIPWSEGGERDEARLNALLSVHGPDALTTWNAGEEGQLVGFVGDGPFTPCARFTYTDADVLIWETELALDEACPPPAVTMDQLEELKRRGEA